MKGEPSQQFNSTTAGELHVPCGYRSRRLPSLSSDYLHGSDSTAHMAPIHGYPYWDLFCIPLEKCTCQSGCAAPCSRQGATCRRQ